MILPTLIHDRKIRFLSDEGQFSFNSHFITLLNDSVSQRRGDFAMSFDTRGKKLTFQNLKGQINRTEDISEVYLPEHGRVVSISDTANLFVTMSDDKKILFVF